LVGFFRIHLKALGKVRCGWVLSVEDTLSEAQGKFCARKDRMESSGWRFQTYVSYVHLLPGMKFMDVTGLLLWLSPNRWNMDLPM